MTNLDKGHIEQAVAELAHRLTAEERLPLAVALATELPNAIEDVGSSLARAKEGTRLSALAVNADVDRVLAYTRAIYALVQGNVLHEPEMANELGAEFEEEVASLYENQFSNNGDWDLSHTDNFWDLAIAFYTGWLALGGRN